MQLSPIAAHRIAIREPVRTEVGTVGIKIVGTGAYLPERIASNEDFARLVETSDEWIVSRTGIRERHVATDMLNWEMGEKAAAQALSDAGVAPGEVDMVIVSTVTPDYLSPSTACIIANALGMEKPGCFDINSACAAFVAAVDLAEKYLASGSCKTVLVISSEMLTKITDYTDRSPCVLFGDGAGAAVLRFADAMYETDIGSDPTGCGKLFARGVPPANPFREKAFDWAYDGLPETNGFGLHQDGRDVYKFATRAMPAAVESACQKAGIRVDELDWIFSHQANQRILETAAKNLGVPMDKFYVNIADHGNISSACIPVCLAEASRSGALKRGDRICIVGFGAGLVYAASVFEW